MRLSPSAEAFSRAAATYDDDFSTLPGVEGLRERVRRVLREYVPEGGRILELGCGTGADAAALTDMGYQVVATDPSPEMVAHTRKRLQHRVSQSRTLVLAAEETPTSFPPADFEAIFSNFGALNCVSEVPGLVLHMAPLLTTGGVLILVLMGRTSLWEMAAKMRTLRVREALRRLRKSPVPARVGEQEVPVWYYGISRLRRAWKGAFTILECVGLNIVSPPPGYQSFAARHPALTRFLVRLDAAIGRVPVLCRCGDHVLLVLRRDG